MFLMLVMIILHSGSGIEMDVNPMLITNMRNPEPNNPAFTPNVKCLINMSDGKFVTVRETCDEVRRLMEARRKSLKGG